MYASRVPPLSCDAPRRRWLEVATGRDELAARREEPLDCCAAERYSTAAHLPQPAERPCGQRARTFLSFSERSSSAAPSIGYPQALEGFEVGLEELIEGGGAGIAGPVSEGTEGGVLSAPIAKLASEDAGRAVSCRAV
jgi:hypothetical protein